MKRIIDVAKQQYKDRLDNKPHRIVVEEWIDPETDAPLEIFVWPANMATRDKIYRAIAEGGLEAVVLTIILRAKDGNKQPLFQMKDKSDLMKFVDADILARIATEINMDIDDDEGENNEARKN